MARIGLVAHDDKKDDLVAWANKHKHKLGAARTCGRPARPAGGLSRAPGSTVTRLLSGPLGGDAQLGAMIAEGRLDALDFLSGSADRACRTMSTSRR